MTAVPSVGVEGALEVIATTLAAAAREGVDIGDLLSAACTSATRMLPAGMSLVDNRPGSWEASHIEGLTDPDAVAQGPRPEPGEVSCPRCGSGPGDVCFTPRYEDRKAFHLARREAARTAVWCGPDLGWIS